MQSYTKKTLATFIILVHIAFFTPFSDVTEAAILEPGFEVELIASGFTLPTAMTFAPDGRIFVAEKGGAVQVVKNGALLPMPAITLTDINTFGDRGLIGMAIDPNFAANGYLYLSYTYENSPGSNFSGPKTGRVVRVTVIGDTASESSKIVLVGTIGGSPALPSCEDYPSGSDCIPSDSMSHSTGGLRFGPDDKLYATFGDGSAFDTVDSRALRAQNLNSLGGKMIRINADGTAPLDNPFYNGDPNANISKVYVLGLRNAFRFNFQPGTGSLFLGDVGWSNWEEVNLVTPGANFGWPCREGMNTTTYNCTASSSVTNPLYVYGHDSNGAGSITAGSFPSNGAYPAQYDNSFFFGDYAQNWIKRLVVSASSTATSVENFMDDTAGQVPNGPVDISAGPDGNIYFLSIYTGDLNRLTHTTGNRRPVPAISANPTSGLTPLTVNFGSVGSIDPDNDPLTYSWNFGDGGTETSTNPTHIYTIDGTYTASLTLTDDKGSSASKSITINAGNQEPSPQITNPASGTLYMANQTIQLNGTATDPEDGTLPAPAFHWQIILHHNTHTHMIQEFDGVINPSFLGPDHGATDVYTEVVLTVTDSGGLTNARSINLYLNNGGSSGNLISNPSVEVEDPLPGRPFKWFQGWFGNLNPIFTYPVSGFEGTKAVQLEITSYTNGGAKWYFDPVFITPGEEYVFSNYYTANAPSTYTAQFGFSDGTFQYQSLGDVPPTVIPTKIEKNIIAPTGAQTVTVFHELDRVGILTTDTYSLTLASTLSDTTSPVVSISTPSTGSTASSTITVSVNATDDVGVVGVTLFVDDVAVLTEDTTSPYDFVWDTTTVTNGSHILSAHARDAASNVAVSTGITVTVDNTAPPNLIQNGLLEIQNGANPLAWTSNSWGNNTAIHTYPVTGFNGQKAVRTEITNYPADGTGDAKWYFDQVAVTPGTTYTYTDHYRSNTISDIIGRYTLTGGGFHYFGLAKEIQPSLAWQTVSGTFTPPSDGTHVTFLHLISAVGFVEVDDAEMYVSGTSTPSETNVPIVAFTNPLLGQNVSGTITLTASSTDDTAVTYIFYAVDGIPITGQITQPPYSFNWNTTTVSNGSHTLKATTHDPSGNNSTHTITITVDNTAPPTSNLITNPSLETIGGNGDPQNWFRGGWGTNNRVFTYPVAGTAGANAAKVEITSYTNGDAKWYFGDATVTAGNTYTFSHSYRSNTISNATIRYTKTDGTFQYMGLANLPVATNWTNATETITIPAGIVSMTIFHSLLGVGWLEIDNYSLTMGTLDTFTRGMVTFTLDDGWLSHYTNALPILNTAGVPGTFFIVSAETQGAVPDERITNPSLETIGGNGDPQNWFRGGWGTNNRVFTYPVAGTAGANAAKVEITSYTNGDAKWYFGDATVIPNQDYIISDSYNSTASSEAVLRYTLTNGTFGYAFLAALPSTGGAWQNFTKTITIPANVGTTTLFHVLPGVGSLTVDNYSLKRVQVYVDPAQMLTIKSTGHEIAGHTRTHADLTTLAPIDQETEIVGSRTDLLGMGVGIVNTFAYPFGGYNDAIQTTTQNGGYIAGRSADRGYNVKSTNKYALKIQQVNRVTTPAEVQAWTNQAAQDKTWLILMFHQIDGDLDAVLGTTPALFQQMVDSAKTANVDIVTMRNGVARMNP